MRGIKHRFAEATVLKGHDRMDARKTHWENIYGEKAPDAVSWYQAVPTLSGVWINETTPERGAAVIDVGGGASCLVDTLLQDGYTDLSVMDLSGKALATSRERLGDRASKVRWIEGDVTAFKPERAYDLWHDRAVFHFLTDEKDRALYKEALRKGLKPGGHVILATFAPDGPKKCSNLDICPYGEEEMAVELGAGFRLLRTQGEDHLTPWGAVQKFRYFLFKKE